MTTEPGTSTTTTRETTVRSAVSAETGTVVATADCRVEVERCGAALAVRDAIGAVVVLAAVGWICIQTVRQLVTERR